MDYSTAKHYAEDIQEIKIMFRRAGPNYIEGLRKVKAASDKLGLGLSIYGSKTHTMAVVPTALDISEFCPSLIRARHLGHQRVNSGTFRQGWRRGQVRPH